MEVYSYLLSLWEFRNSIELHGFDINLDGLEVAARGIFRGRQPLRNLLLDCLPVSFQDEALVTRSVLTEAIESVRKVERMAGAEMWFQFGPLARSQVRFSFHDILDSPLPARFEVISLLKVLLHYPRESRLAILANIHASLVEGGWLLIDSDYADDDHVFDKGNYESDVRNELRDSGFIRMPAYAPGWWGGPEDLTHKVMLCRRQ
jgi:chemotaxis methyl-accepting protein methylase